MSRSARMEHLKPGDWERLREAAEQFEQGWRDHTNVDLASFLPRPDDPLYRAILEELVKTDLEIRRGRGQAVSLEYYLEKYPELGEARHLPARLIYEEYRVRRRFGEPLVLESYRQRFPDQFGELERLVGQQSLPAVSGTLADPSPSLPRPRSVMDPHNGDILPVGEGYRMIKFINAGTFGEVWQVEAPGGFPAAVKIIRRTLDSEESRRELRSLEVIKRLSHPFLLKTQAAWAFQDRLVILMDLAECTLRERLNQCKAAGAVGIPVAELLRYFQEAAEALDYLHGEGVLHRDVKPQNLLLSNGHVKVADFGLVRDENQQQRSHSTAGTPGYMAPEAWRGSPCPASDQYSLALTYAELRLGRWPFDATDPMNLMLAHLEGTPLLSRLGEAEQRVLLRGMNKAPADRFPNCLALVAALRVALPGDPAAHDLPAAPRFRPAPPTRPMAKLDIPGAISESHSNARDTTASKQPSAADSLKAPPLAGGAAELAAVGMRTSGEDSGSLLVSEVSTSPILPAGATAPAEAPAGHWQTGPKRRRSPPWWAAIVLLVLVGVGAVVWHLLRPAPPLLPPLEVRPKVVYPHPGASKTVAIHIERRDFREVVRLEASSKGSAGLTVHPTDIPADGDSSEVHVDVAPEAALGLRRVSVTARAKGQEQTTSFAVVVLPPGYEPVSGKEIGPYPARIARRVGGQKVVFVLIQPDGKPDTPFYLMENKVSNGVFRAFALENRQALAGSLWQRGGVANGHDAGDDDELPVLRVTRPEAESCAAWLGGVRGVLPTARQLDLAFGYDGRRKLPPPRAAAVNRIQQGPRKITEHSDDVSPYGIRDLAGNGREWTRDTFRLADGTEMAVLRGRSYTAPEPLLYADLDEWNKKDSEIRPRQFPDHASPYTGFRVIIELPGLTRDK